MHKSAFFLLVPTDSSIQSAKTLKLDSVFASSTHLSVEVISKLRAELGEKIQINAEIGIFAGKDLLEKFSDAKPVEALNTPTEKDWYCGICPTHEGVRSHALEKIKALFALDINGIWLDFIRYPSKWEEPEPYILDTCYCDRCMQKFSEYIGEPIAGNSAEEKALLIDGSYYIEWLEFKCGQITSMVKAVQDLIKESGKNIKLGFFAVPWDEKEHGAAIKRVLGQDFAALSGLVDTVSPMLYHKMCGKDVDWIKEKVDFFWQLGISQLPLVQTEPRVAEISADEFNKALEFASVSPSTGVCIFFLEDLVKHEKLFEKAQNFFAKSNDYK